MVLQIAGCRNQEIESEDTELIVLGIDSIGLITLVCMIEDEFKIEISGQDLFQIICFRDIIDMVCRLIGK